MNPKINKLRAELEKNNGKIAALQAKNKELEKQIRELENLDIVGMVREQGMTMEQFAELFQIALLQGNHYITCPTSSIRFCPKIVVHFLDSG